MSAESPSTCARRRVTRVARIACVAALFFLGGCHEGPPQALGTLEYDRVTLPSPAAERIVSIEVHEGEQVDAGQVLLRLDPTRIEANAAAAGAEAERAQQTLAELEAGPRSEDIAQARAQLASAQAQTRDARATFRRASELGRQGVAAPAEVDCARATLGTAEGQEGVARARLLELRRGTRPEQIGQGEAAAAAAQEQATAAAAILDKLTVCAPRAGQIDSLPYHLGDQAPVGAPLAVLLVGDAPYARVYVPEPVRAHVRVGQKVQVFVDGEDTALDGRVRMVRSEPSFTPYYALTGDDAARLSYLAEVELTDSRARRLPAGLPVRVVLAPPADAGT